MVVPKRIIDTEPTDATSEFERELLSSLRAPAEARGLVWQRVAAQVGVSAGAIGVATGVVAKGAAAGKAGLTTGAAVGGSAVASSSSGVSGVGAASSATTSLLPGAGKLAGAALTPAAASATLAGKLGIALLVAAPLLGGGFYIAKSMSAFSPEAPSPVNPPAKAKSAPVVTSAMPSALPRALPTAEPSGEAPKPRAKLRPPNSEPKHNALLEENRLLREARAAARAGKPQTALKLLRTLDRRFPGGALAQEREVLRIQTLAASGAHSQASSRAARFVQRYPKSPYAPHVKTFAELKDAELNEPRGDEAGAESGLEHR